jgi:hypothetical protein
MKKLLLMTIFFMMSSTTHANFTKEQVEYGNQYLKFSKAVYKVLDFYEHFKETINTSKHFNSGRWSARDKRVYQSYTDKILVRYSGFSPGNMTSDYTKFNTARLKSLTIRFEHTYDSFERFAYSKLGDEEFNKIFAQLNDGKSSSYLTWYVWGNNKTKWFDIK